MNAIGIRQGRLSAETAGRAQRFPWRSWHDEFAGAATCGFATIEWLFAADDYERNPMWIDAGREQIRQQIVETGVQVRSLCADYFLSHPFFRVPDADRRHSISVLMSLIARSARVGVQTIVLPVLETSEIRNTGERAQLLESLETPLAAAAEHGVRLGLETELPGPQYRMLVEQTHHPSLGICYDTGNAAAKGYDVSSDVRTLGPYLCEVHIKDRRRNGPSVPLGQGDADFAGFFRAVIDVGYTGLLILETPAGHEPVGVAAAHMAFLNGHR